MSDELGRIGEALPDYEITRELGRGGMGVVFLGKHRRLDRPVAIKELPPTFAVEDEVRARFSTEAKTLASLAHPHIVPIYDYVERDGLCLIVMEQLPGGTVWDRFTTTGLTPPTACAVVMACCAALQHAHDKGVLHLDVKPDNLMFDAVATIKVTDFGISRVISGGRTLGTVDGQVLGTPAYMSPEQAKGADLTPASDVYAAGVMLYELLSGHLPWTGAQTASELLAQRLKEPPTPLREVAPHVPEPLAAVVMRALSKDPEERYERAEDFGVAVAEAAAESWGPEWLDVAGVAIVGSERLTVAARTTGSTRVTGSLRTTGGGAPATTADTLLPGAARTSGAGETVVSGPAAMGERAGETIVAGAAPDVAPPRAAATGAMGAATVGEEGRAAETSVVGAGTPAPPAATPGGGGPAAPAAPAAPGGPPQLPDFQVVRAAGAEERIQGADLNRLERADLIGVEDVLNPPKVPWLSILATAVLFTVAAAVAWIGLADPSYDQPLDAGQVTVQGVDVASGDRIPLDLSKDVQVELVAGGGLRRQVTRVTLESSLLGVPLGSASADVDAGVAVIDAGLMQRLVAGEATGRVVLRAGRDVVGETEFPIDATQAWYLTAVGLGGVLAILLGIANMESSLKPLRRGRLRVVSVVGAAISGGILGVGAVLVANALGGAQATYATLGGSAAVAAVGGAALAVAIVGLARRRRIRGAVKRAERTLGVRATGQHAA